MSVRDVSASAPPEFVAARVGSSVEAVLAVAEARPFRPACAPRPGRTPSFASGDRSAASCPPAGRGNGWRPGDSVASRPGRAVNGTTSAVEESPVAAEREGPPWSAAASSARSAASRRSARVRRAVPAGRAVPVSTLSILACRFEMSWPVRKAHDSSFLSRVSRPVSSSSLVAAASSWSPSSRRSVAMPDKIAPIGSASCWPCSIRGYLFCDRVPEPGGWPGDSIRRFLPLPGVRPRPDGLSEARAPRAGPTGTGAGAAEPPTLLVVARPRVATPGALAGVPKISRVATGNRWNAVRVARRAVRHAVMPPTASKGGWRARKVRSTLDSME
ncbi:Uncharacterised protein [Nocardia farcinica]|uniref:Uncharacterized protein n=1 Tax=Nocardia farcinica TaxID=37329 RepID=A0A0H5NEG2_NOCFR|nr:Uncharacterised protein [Nocardia farcinica]